MKIVAVLEGEKVAIREETEYAAFGFDVDKQEYVSIGRPVGTELLCLNRLNEAVEKGLVPKSIDCMRTVIRKRKVITCVGGWEAME